MSKNRFSKIILDFRQMLHLYNKLSKQLKEKRVKTLMELQSPFQLFKSNIKKNMTVLGKENIACNNTYNMFGDKLFFIMKINIPKNNKFIYLERISKQNKSDFTIPGTVKPKIKMPARPVTKPAAAIYKPITGRSAETALYNFAVKMGLKGIELAAFMGQSAHESDGFKTAEEYASGDAYEGRKDLGNIHKGDGRKYKGRGFIQITGRYNYTAAGKALGLDLVNHPELAEEPVNAAKVTWWYWKNKVRPHIGNFDNTKAVTKKIQGGSLGLKSREKYTQSFKLAQK